jgi:YVTN family beta-propeller protein
MRAALIALMFAALLIAGCGSSRHRSSTSGGSSTTTAPSTARHRFASPPADNVYAYDGAGHLSPAARGDRALVYVPNSMSDSVTVISQRTLKVVAQFPTGALPQHVTPAYNLKTLYVDNDLGNSLTPINPRTGAPGRPIPVEDPTPVLHA